MLMKRLSSGLRGEHSTTTSFWVPKFWLYSSESLVQLSLVRRHLAQGLLHRRLSMIVIQWLLTDAQGLVLSLVRITR